MLSNFITDEEKLEGTETSFEQRMQRIQWIHVNNEDIFMKVETAKKRRNAANNLKKKVKFRRTMYRSANEFNTHWLLNARQGETIPRVSMNR